jgi:hypothetical protein
MGGEKLLSFFIGSQSDSSRDWDGGIANKAFLQASVEAYSKG